MGYGTTDYLLLLTEFLPLGIGLWLFEKLNRGFRLLVPLFGFALMANLVFALMRNEGLNAMPLMHLVTPLEFSVFMLVFSVWYSGTSWSLLLRACIPLFFAIILNFKLLDIEPVDAFDGFSSSLECLWLSVTSVIILINLNRNPPDGPLHTMPQLWLIASVLVYCMGNLLFFASVQLSLSITIPVHEIVNPIVNIGYSGAFLCFRKPRQKSSS